MIDTDSLRKYAGWLGNVDNEGHPKDFSHDDYEALAALLREAAGELDAARNKNLVKYRAAALSKLAGNYLDDNGPGRTGAQHCANRVEEHAQAQLAAERAPDAGAS